MKHWNIVISNQSLKKIYESYLYRQERTLTFYLASIAVSNHAHFPVEFHDTKIKASNNFDDNATSMKSVREIHEMITDGRYDHYSRSTSVFSLVTSFTDFFSDIKKLLNLDDQAVKKPVELTCRHRGKLLFKPAALKIAHHINLNYELNARISDVYSMRWINCVINLRHMFAHDKGQFNDQYKKEMVASWAELNDGDPILFNENQVDSILWFLNDHVRNFSENLDKKI